MTRRGRGNLPPTASLMFPKCSHIVAAMPTPISALFLTNDKLLIECSYCALIRVLDPLEACVAFGEETTFDQIESKPCPRCQITNDRTLWQRAKIATPEDLLRVAHPGRGGGRGHGRAPKKRSSKRWAD